MTNALSIYNQFDKIQSAALALAKSGYFADVKSEAQAIVKVMAGAELGLPPFASMSGIHIIQGKPVIGANVMATLVKNDPRYDYHVKVCDNKSCALEWFENGKRVGESTFTIQEAQDAGLTTKDNWRKWTSDMLFARALSRGSRRFAPGIFGGSPVYTPDELGADIDPEGYVDTTVTEVTAPRPAETIITELGYGPAPEPEPEYEDELQYPVHLLNVTNSEGVPYTELSNDALDKMMIGIKKALAKTDLTDDQKSQYNMKHDAIRQIQALRLGK